MRKSVERRCPRRITQTAVAVPLLARKFSVHLGDDGTATPVNDMSSSVTTVNVPSLSRHFDVVWAETVPEALPHTPQQHHGAVVIEGFVADELAHFFK